MRELAPVAAAILLVSSTLLAQTPQQPVFRTDVELIEVDVTVLGDDGQPLEDLRGPEFAVTIDGQPRRVVEAQYISLRPDRSDARAADEAPPEVFYSSNSVRRLAGSAAPGRLILIAFDRDNVAFGEGRHAARAAARFLDTLHPADKVGFVSVPQPGPMVDFTSNHRLVREELERTAGLAHPPQRLLNIGVHEAFALVHHTDARAEDEVLARFCGQFRLGTVQFEECALAIRAEAGMIVQEVTIRTDQAIRALETMVRALRDVDGPKALVWISEGLVLEGAGAELTTLERLAATARVSIHIVMLDAPLADVSVSEPSPTAREDRDLQVRGLELLAARTRGALFHAYQSADPVFKRIDDELAGYYLLGVEALPSDRDGRAHTIDVSVRRRGTQLRARRVFEVAPPVEANERAEDRLVRTLRSPFAVTELPLRLATYVYQDPDSAKVRVLVATEVGRDERRPTDLTLGYALIDRTGAVAASGIERVTIESVDTPAGPVAQHVSTLLIDPGTYTLKRAAVDDGGRRGSVEHVVQAWQMSDVPFAIGDLLLADMPPAAGQPLEPPVEARLSSGHLAAYTEIYADDPGAFDDTQVRIEVATAEGRPAEASAPARLTVGGSPTNRRVTAIVPLPTLPPGAYIARAVVMRGGSEIANLSRPFIVASTPAADASAARPPAVAADAATTVPPPPAAIAALLSTPRAPFEREALLASDVIGFFMNVLDRGRPSLRATTARVRAGNLTGAGRAAFETGDQMAAAFLRGLELLAQGQPAQAATQFVAALSIEPDFAPAAFYLGACYASAGRDPEATTAWRRALLGADKPPIGYLALSDALVRLSEPALAVAPLRDALATWPDDDEIRRRLALAHALAGQYAEALDIVEPYLAEHLTDHEALLVALHALYLSHLQGRPLVEAEQARERMAKYAEAYAAGGGPHAPMIAAWVEVVAGS